MRSSYPEWGLKNALWSSGRGALATLGSRHERRLAAPQPRVLLVAPEQRRLLEAGRLGGLALALCVALLATVRLAVEALDHAERRGALVRVRRDVGVPAIPWWAGRPPAERAAVDDRDLRQVMLLAVIALVAAVAVPGQGGAAHGDELRELPAGEAQVGQDRVELRQEDVRRLEQRLGSPQEALARRDAGLGRPNQRVDVVEELLQVRREIAEVAQRRREVPSRLAQIADQRIRVAGEVLEAQHRGARLAQEGREDLEGLGQRVVARGERAEGRLAVRDQAAQLAVLAGDGVEHAAGVAEDTPEGDFVLGERLEKAGPALEERRGVAERVVEVAREAATRDDAGLVEPLLEGLARVRVEDAEDLVELHRVVHVRPRQRAAVGELLASRRARRDLHVGLAEQALLAQDRARVAADRREAVVDLHLDLRRPSARPQLLRLHLADVHARHAHVGLLDEQRRLREIGLEAIALRLQREGAAERRPEEHQERRHGQREADHRGEASDAGRVLVHGVGRAGRPGRSGRIGPPPPLPGGGVVGRALKLHDPNCVASSWSTGLEPPPPGFVSRSASAGLLSPTSATTSSTIPARTAAGTPQIVTLRHGPWPSAVENRDEPFWAVQASQ